MQTYATRKLLFQQPLCAFIVGHVEPVGAHIKQVRKVEFAATMLDEFASAFPDTSIPKRRRVAVTPSAEPHVVADDNLRADDNYNLIRFIESGRGYATRGGGSGDDEEDDALLLPQTHGFQTPAGGADGPDAVPPPPEREYVSLVRLSEAAVALDTEPTDDPDFCFLCMIGKQARARSSSTHLDSMTELIRTQYMFMSQDELTKRVQHMYNVNLRPTIECEAMRKPWRRRVIWDHIHRHALTPDIATKYHLRVMGTTLDVLAKEGIVYKGATPGALKVDLQNLKVYLAASKEYLRGLSLIADSGGSAAAAAASGGVGKAPMRRVGR